MTHKAKPTWSGAKSLLYFLVVVALAYVFILWFNK